jgi:hypothetical protein
MGIGTLNYPESEVDFLVSIFQFLRPFLISNF